MVSKRHPRLILFGFMVFGFAALIAIFGISFADEIDSRENNFMGWGGGGCYGTYLVQLPNTQAIWTLARDGTFLGTDALEHELGFDQQQGAWKRAGRNARATWLNFRYDRETGEPIELARIDVQFTFGRFCDSISGNFTMRFFSLDEDALDRGNSGTLIVDGDPFDGRRVSP